MKEIIFDLLSVGKSAKTFTINPEVKIKNYIIAAMTFSYWEWKLVLLWVM